MYLSALRSTHSFHGTASSSFATEVHMTSPTPTFVCCLPSNHTWFLTPYNRLEAFHPILFRAPPPCLPNNAASGVTHPAGWLTNALLPPTTVGTVGPWLRRSGTRPVPRRRNRCVSRIEQNRLWSRRGAQIHTAVQQGPDYLRLQQTALESPRVLSACRQRAPGKSSDAPHAALLLKLISRVSSCHLL